MSRDSRVTLTLFITLRSHSLHTTVSTGGHTSTSISCSLPKWFRTNTPGRFVRLRCKASNCLLQRFNLRVLPCCCEQTAFQHVRNAGKGQAICLEWELGCPCRLGDPHDADRARQQVYFDIALRYACIILGCDRINISSKVLST